MKISKQFKRVFWSHFLFHDLSIFILCQLVVNFVISYFSKGDIGTYITNAIIMCFGFAIGGTQVFARTYVTIVLLLKENPDFIKTVVEDGE